MNLYVWIYDGVVVVAPNLKDAILMAEQHRGALASLDPNRTYRLDTGSDEFDVDPGDVYPPEVLTIIKPDRMVW